MATNIIVYTQKILAAIARKEKRVLFKSGAYGRRVMRSGMRPGGKKRKSSAPGQYPRYHQGSNRALRHVLFEVNLRDGTVVIGPPIGWTKQILGAGDSDVISRTQFTGKTVPQLVNDGGRSVVTTLFESGVSQSLSVNHDARPFVALSMPQTTAFFKHQMKDTVTPFR
jgi:hypothetical protein